MNGIILITTSAFLHRFDTYPDGVGGEVYLSLPDGGSRGEDEMASHFFRLAATQGFGFLPCKQNIPSVIGLFRLTNIVPQLN